MSLHVSNVAQQGTTSAAVRGKAAEPGVRQVASKQDPQKADAAQQARSTQDKVTLGQTPAPTLTYAAPSSSNKVAQSDVAAAVAESERKAQEVMDLIRPMLEQQGLNVAKVASGEQQLDVDPATIDAAKAAIAEGGEFSVENVADRILSFAKSMISADPSRFDAVLGAVEKGFQDAQRMLGGTLPEISQKTHAAVQAEFQRWKSDGISAD